jgi:OOP family OmpA-OmpF porin
MHWIIVLMGLCGYAQAQTNLVPNGDFEFHTTLQASDCAIEDASPWFDTGYSVDYFSAARSLQLTPPDTFYHCHAPENVRGYQHARSGISYAGFHAFSKYQRNGREFIQIELLQPISSGVRYEVSFHVSLADCYKFAVKTLGAYFSHSAIFRTQYEIDELNIIPQIINNTAVLDDKETWQEVRDTFASRTGGERYLVIGNFNLDETSDTLLLETGLHDHSYYYIDDVSVIALDSVPSSINEQEYFDFSVYPNPATEVIRIDSQRLFNSVRLMDILGKEVFRGDVSGKTNIFDISGIPAGVYMVAVSDTAGRTAIKRIVKTDEP